MADTVETPASATQSVGSVTGGTPAADKGEAAPSELETRMATLTEQNEKILKQMGEQRSFHDRQMTEMRAVVNASRSAPETTVDEGTEQTQQQPKLSAREVQRDIDMALMKIRQSDPTWGEYEADVFAITADGAKAAPFKIVDAQGNVDFHASLLRIKEHIEALRTRASVQEAADAKTKADATRVAARGQAHISGGGAAMPVDNKAFESMNYKEKLKFLKDNAPELFDERDLPESLRK